MNQPPQTEKQAGKRIVSKWEYVNQIRKKISLSGIGLTYFIIGLILLPYLCSMINEEWLSHPTHHLDDLVAAVIFAAIPVTLLLCGVFVVKDAKKIDVGVPLTRANTADLPAPDSLVRASTEPVQEQQAVLLRAVAETSERHEEQLVRASTEEME